MYLSEKPCFIDFYKEEGVCDMMIEEVSNGNLLRHHLTSLSPHSHYQHQHQQMILSNSGGGNKDHDVERWGG